MSEQSDSAVPGVVHVLRLEARDSWILVLDPLDVEWLIKSGRTVIPYVTQAALLASEARTREVEDVLGRTGFTRCDIAACNCGSWHRSYGLPERRAIAAAAESRAEKALAVVVELVACMDMRASVRLVALGTGMVGLPDDDTYANVMRQVKYREPLAEKAARALIAEMGEKA